MIVEIQINGRRRRVTVDAVGPGDGAGASFRVAIAPAELEAPSTPAVFEVAARRTAVGVNLTYAAEERSIEVAVTSLADGQALVQLPQVDLRTVIDGRRSRAGRREAAGSGVQQVIAPMPGRIVRVLVAVGDEVAARQPLVVIEAMKMENELCALRPGRVREVLVGEATSVEAGRLLMVVE